VELERPATSKRNANDTEVKCGNAVGEVGADPTEIRESFGPGSSSRPASPGWVGVKAVPEISPESTRPVGLWASQIAPIEVDDLQAVGVRARETLLGLARLMHADLASNEEDPPQLGNFVAWSERACAAWLPGKRLVHLRRSLKNATENVVSLAEVAMCAPRRSDPAQCARCGSRRLARDYHWNADEELQFTMICDSCGWSSGGAQPETWQAGEPVHDPADSECTLDGFAETMTPADAMRRSDAALEFGGARTGQPAPAATHDGEECAQHLRRGFARRWHHRCASPSVLDAQGHHGARYGSP